MSVRFMNKAWFSGDLVFLKNKEQLIKEEIIKTMNDNYLGTLFGKYMFQFKWYLQVLLIQKPSKNNKQCPLWSVCKRSQAGQSSPCHCTATVVLCHCGTSATATVASSYCLLKLLGWELWCTLLHQYRMAIYWWTRRVKMDVQSAQSSFTHSLQDSVFFISFRKFIVQK